MIETSSKLFVKTVLHNASPGNEGRHDFRASETKAATDHDFCPLGNAERRSVLLLALLCALATIAITLAVPVAAQTGFRLGTEPQLILDTGAPLTQPSELAFSPDGTRLAVAGDKVVRIYNLTTQRLETTLRGDRSRVGYGSVNTVTYSPDGRQLLVGITDNHPRGSIRIYQTSNTDQIDQVLPGLTQPCVFIRFSKDGRFMATTDQNGEICLWDWRSRRIVKRIPPPNPDKPVLAFVDFADTAPLLVTMGYDRPHVYLVPEGRELQLGEMHRDTLGWLYDVENHQAAWPHFTDKRNVPRYHELQFTNRQWIAAGRGKSSAQATQSSKYWAGVWPMRSLTMGDLSSGRAQQMGLNQPKVVYNGHRWEIKTIAARADASALRRRHQRQARVKGSTGRDLIGSPFRKRLSSSANSLAV